MDKSNINAINFGAKNMGLELSNEQLEAFNMFGDLLIEKSRYVNLTSIKDERDIVAKHFLDSLTPAAYIIELSSLRGAGCGSVGGDLGCGGVGGGGGAGSGNAGTGSGVGGGVGCGSGGSFGDNRCRSGSGSARASGSITTLVDIGSGAGFPGIPLKILYGDILQVTLIESVRKKVDFMNEIITALKLKGCEAIHIRAEDAPRRDELRERFDFATARALAPMPKLLEYAMPLLRCGGMLIAMKGKSESALKELPQANINQFQLINFELISPYNIYERTLIAKRKPTSPKSPSPARGRGFDLL